MYKNGVCASITKAYECFLSIRNYSCLFSPPKRTSLIRMILSGIPGMTKLHRCPLLKYSKEVVFSFLENVDASINLLWQIDVLDDLMVKMILVEIQVKCWQFQKLTNRLAHQEQLFRSRQITLLMRSSNHFMNEVDMRVTLL